MDQSGRYTTQQRIKIIETYFAAKSVLKNSKNLPKNSDTVAMQEYFGRNNVPDGRAIQRLVAKFRKTGSVADAHKGLDRLSFSIIPENIHNLRKRHEDFPRKSTHLLSQETGISRTSVLRILHDDLKLFPYKIQILQRQTDQNKAERETFCEDISQRIDNNPGLLDLNDLNNVGHRGFCGASVTHPVSQNLGTKH